MSNVSFSIGTNLKEYPSIEEELFYPAKLKIFLYQNFSNITNRCDLLIQIDEYSDKLFLASEVNELIGICELLIQRYCYPKEPWMLEQADKIIKDLYNFLEALKSLCIEAIYKNSLICFWGN